MKKLIFLINFKLSRIAKILLILYHFLFQILFQNSFKFLYLKVIKFFNFIIIKVIKQNFELPEENGI